MNKLIKMVTVAAILTLGAGGLATAEHDAEKTSQGATTIGVFDPASGDFILSAGVVACQGESAALPGFCSGAGLGGAIFDISDLNENKTQHVIKGQVTVTTVSCNPCGAMHVIVCNDRDDNNICTNQDPIDDDGPDKSSHHGTNASYDDQSINQDCGKKLPGDVCVVKFCFANDAGTHDWDDIAVFIKTSLGNLNQGTKTIKMSDVEHVGDNLSSCPAGYLGQQNKF